MPNTIAELRAGARHLVTHCAAVQRNEQVLVIATAETEAVGNYVVEALYGLAGPTALEIMGTGRMHGSEPPRAIAEEMARADVIFCLTQNSLAHTQARKVATEEGARYLSLPDYSLDVLASASVLTDFESLEPLCEQIGTLLDAASEVQIRSDLGTNLTFAVNGRDANRCPGIVRRRGELGSPPDAEVNIAPLEGSVEGVIVVDGSVPCPQIGLLPSPVTIIVERGAARRFSCAQSAIATELDNLFEGVDSAKRVIAEFGIGLNPNARLCGIMLEDEGCAGTVHFGIGDNSTIGGTNKVGFHLDFILRQPDVFADGRPLMKSGKLL